MRCEQCGHINDPGVPFCAQCGALLSAGQTPAQPQHQNPYQAQNQASYQAPYQQPNQDPYQSQYQQPQQQYQQYQSQYQQPGQYSPYPGVPEGKPTSKLKSLPLKKILLIGVPVIVVVIAAIVIISLLSKGGGSVVKNNISFFTDRGVVFVSGDNNPKFSLDGDIYSTQRSMDGSKAVVLLEYRSNTGGELWFVSTSTAYQIADDVMAYRLSDSGNGVVYLTDYDSRNSVATLFLYDTSSRGTVKITEDAFYYGSSDMMGICISPNGKSVGYISDYDDRDEEFTGYIKVDGKTPEKIGKDTFAVAISDGGRHLYYVKKSDDGYSGSLHFRSGRNDTRLASDANSLSVLMFNSDYSEAMFVMEDKTYISRGGNERERISSLAIYRLVLPRGTQVSSNADRARIMVYGIRNFNDFVAVTGDGLVHIDSNMESNRISSSSNYANYASISPDGKTLLFVNNNGHLSSINPTIPGAERKEIARNIESYVATSDCKTIYYVNEDDELWCVKGNGAPIKVSDDVDANSIALSYNGARIFFLVDYRSSRGGELYFSNNGGRRAAIPGADETLYVWCTPTCAFYMNRDDEVFRSNGNEVFSLFEQDISISYY